MSIHIGLHYIKNSWKKTQKFSVIKLLFIYRLYFLSFCFVKQDFFYLIVIYCFKSYRKLSSTGICLCFMSGNRSADTVTKVLPFLIAENIHILTAPSTNVLYYFSLLTVRCLERLNVVLKKSETQTLVSYLNLVKVTLKVKVMVPYGNLKY